MKLTNALKAELTTVCGVKADATDEEFTKAVGQAFADDKLTVARYAELTKDPRADEANEFAIKLDRIADGLSKLVEAQTKEVKIPEVKEPETKDV